MELLWLWIVIAVVVIVVAIVMGTYNGLVGLRNQVKKGNPEAQQIIKQLQNNL